MPTYSYSCREPECDKHQDFICKISEMADIVVPTCPVHSVKMVKDVSAPAFSLKGSGWTPKFHG